SLNFSVALIHSSFLYLVYPSVFVYKLVFTFFAAGHSERPPVSAAESDDECRHEERQYNECIEQEGEYDDARDLDQYDHPGWQQCCERARQDDYGCDDSDTHAPD